MKKYYAFYYDSFDWGISTNANQEGDYSLWEQCDSLAKAKKALKDFFAERIAENRRMKRCAGKINRKMICK